MALRQTISQRLEQKLSPQQIQLMKLLQIPTVELEQRVKQELEINPALEEGKEESLDDDFEQDDFSEEAEGEERDFDIEAYLSDDEPTYKTQISNKGRDEEEKTIPISSGTSFSEYLLEQLQLQKLTEEELKIATYIIGSLNESGYLDRDLEALIDDLAFYQNMNVSEKEIEKILTVVQRLDPPGVAARNLKECLILQMERKQDGNISRYTALKILEDFFEEFTKKHYHKITHRLEIDEEDLKDAIQEIIRLNPKPGGSLKGTAKIPQQIVPDFLVTEEEGKLTLTLHGKSAPELRISEGYKSMMKTYSEGAELNKADKEALSFVKSKLEAAKWFIDAIQQRQNTLYMTMKAIMEYQKNYFLTGDEAELRPMILKDVAEMIDLDVSTISRVVNSKFVQTEYGTLSLKFFFSESFATESGEEISTREVKQIISDIISAEDKRKPLTDEKLGLILKEKGYNIARRTIAKYREQLNISVARLRKEL